MSKVEELAKKYCKGSSFEDACMEKPAYIAGYHQAEKDLKGALVAEIEKWIKHYNESAKEFGDEGYNDNVLMEQCKANACKYILSSLDTLKTKECEEEPYITKKVGSYTTTTKVIKKGE